VTDRKLARGGRSRCARRAGSRPVHKSLRAILSTSKAPPDRHGIEDGGGRLEASSRSSCSASCSGFRVDPHRQSSLSVRDEIVDLARRISYTPDTMQVLAEEYMGAGMRPRSRMAGWRWRGPGSRIESTFGQIGEMFERIETFRRQLEARVAQPINMPSAARRAGRRAADLVSRLDLL